MSLLDETLQGSFSLLFSLGNVLYLYDVLRRASWHSEWCCPPQIPILGYRKAPRFESGH